MLGNNLTLRTIIQDRSITESPFLGIQPFNIPGVGQVSFGTYGDIHVDTLCLTVFSMALILSAALVVRPSLTSTKAGGTGQALFEMYYEFIGDLTKSQMGHVYKSFLPLIGGMFIFILIGNFVGIAPWQVLEAVPNWPKMADGELFEVAAPTTDFNVTMAMAAISLLTYLGSGFWAHGLHYLKVWFSPMVIIEIMDLIIRPATLALRLMIVITADELLRASAILMVPMLVPTGVMAFELFIALIQAFVFTLLTTIYIGLTVSHDH
jgi:F-type H+-transporting ATPase subunit a